MGLTAWYTQRMDYTQAVELCGKFRRRSLSRSLSCELVPEGYVKAERPAVRPPSIIPDDIYLFEHGEIAISQYVDQLDYAMVFKGGKTGEHHIAISTSTPERAWAHWRGYAENSNLLFPTVHEMVQIDEVLGFVTAVDEKRDMVHVSSADSNDDDLGWHQISDIKFIFRH